jgi:hypothetical protein
MKVIQPAGYRGNAAQTGASQARSPLPPRSSLGGPLLNSGCVVCENLVMHFVVLPI